jgi:hypothetical protein
MYRIADVYAGLKGLIGWRASFDSEVPTVDSGNLASSSGLYYQDFSALVTLNNLYLSQNYEAITADQFNTMLGSMEQSAINKVINAVFVKDDIVDTKMLYPGADVFTNSIENTTSFVGFEIDLYNRADIALNLNRVFTAFDTNDTIKLLLFHSSQKEPISEKEISTIANNNTITALDWALSAHKYGYGRYYVGYLRSGLTAKAYNREYEDANVKNCYAFAGFKPILVSDWDSETLFDIEDIEYSDKTYGLNFDASSVVDFTDFILANSKRFTNAIGMQMAIDILDVIISTTRSNFVERNLSFDAKLEREGNILNAETDIPKSAGMIRRLAKEVNVLRSALTEQQAITRMTLR